MARPAVAHTYRYAFASEAVATSVGMDLRLATSGPDEGAADYFRGRLTRPQRAADLLRGLVEVVQSRFYVPPAMLRESSRWRTPWSRVAMMSCGSRRSPPAAARMHEPASSRPHSTANAQAGARPTWTSTLRCAPPWRGCATPTTSAWPSARARWSCRGVVRPSSSGRWRCRCGGSRGSWRCRRTRGAWSGSSRRRARTRCGSCGRCPVRPDRARHGSRQPDAGSG